MKKVDSTSNLKLGAIVALGAAVGTIGASIIKKGLKGKKEPECTCGFDNFGVPFDDDYDFDLDDEFAWGDEEDDYDDDGYTWGTLHPCMGVSPKWQAGVTYGPSFVPGYTPCYGPAGCFGNGYVAPYCGNGKKCKKHKK